MSQGNKNIRRLGPGKKSGISYNRENEDVSSGGDQDRKDPATAPSKPWTDKSGNNVSGNYESNGNDPNDNGSRSKKPSGNKQGGGNRFGNEKNDDDTEADDLPGEGTGSHVSRHNNWTKPLSLGGDDSAAEDPDDDGTAGGNSPNLRETKSNQRQSDQVDNDSGGDEEAQHTKPQQGTSKPRLNKPRPQGQSISIGGNEDSSGSQGAVKSKSNGLQDSPAPQDDIEIEGLETAFESDIGGDPKDPAIARIRDYLKRPRKYQPEEIEEELEEVDTKIQESARLRRNGVLVTNKQEMEALRAAAEEIARSKFPDFVKAGIKITTKLIVLAGTIAMMVIAPPSAAGGIPAIIYLVKDVATGIYKTVEAISGIAGIAQGLGKLTPQQEEGMKRLRELTGIDFHKGPQANAEALEAYKQFRNIAAENMKDKKIGSKTVGKLK